MTTTLSTATTMNALFPGESSSYAARTPTLTDRPFAAVPSLSPLGQALQDLAALAANWDGYGADPPTRLALERGWHLASMLVEQGFPVPQIFPTRKGGIQLEWHVPHASLEWELDPSGFTGVFIFDDHRTGGTLDGDMPGSESALVEALVRIRHG